MKQKHWYKNILSMLIIVGVGFILFNVAFILAFIVNTIFNMTITPFIKNLGITGSLNFLWHYIYIILVLLLSWFIFRTRFNDLFKATFSTLPLIVVLTEVGIQFYDKPALVWGLGTAIVGFIFVYLYKTKRPWLYYFATIYVVMVEVFVMVAGVEI